MHLESSRIEASEYRRRLFQGLGRPIVSFETKEGYRCVAVGGELRWSTRWKTFHDFLFDYIWTKLTPEWGKTELKKSDTERHPLLSWYKKVCDFHRRAIENSSHGIYSAAMTGAVRGYLGLAYDLYLCAHNAQLQEVLLDRLRHRDLFEGALHEAHVIGCFAKAGFTIDFEDESDSETSHCEFVAMHGVTHRRFSVEAKAVSSQSTRAGNAAEPPRVRDKLAKALRKTAEHSRVVFIELSRADISPAQSPPPWLAKVTADIRQAELDLFIQGQPAPPAYVFMTNRGFTYALDDTKWPEFAMIEGFRLPDFPPGRNATSILDAYRARERHIEMYWLQKAIETNGDVPSTFDSRTPEEAFSKVPMRRPQIGDTHMVPDGQGCSVL